MICHANEFRGIYLPLTNPLPVKSKHHRFCGAPRRIFEPWQWKRRKREIRFEQTFSSGLHGSTAADSVRSEWPLWHAAKSNAVFARRRIELKLKLKLLDIRAELEREKEKARGARAGVTF
ncbi:hypothetical protein TNCV_3350251 [Trichonephila clavipes]|nr:hypothetical protein TNCV_3350251 [Trichonephila clavipes]